MDAVLDAVEREQRGKNEARRLRAAGKIPAVVYGVREGGKAIAVDPKPLTRILQTELGANTLITLNLPGGGDARVLVKEYQYDPVTHQLLHADFYRVAMDKAIRVNVSVVPRGDLLSAVWGYQQNVSTRTVDIHVSELRAKLEPNPARPVHIITVRKTGYRFEG